MSRLLRAAGRPAELGPVRRAGVVAVGRLLPAAGRPAVPGPGRGPAVRRGGMVAVLAVVLLGSGCTGDDRPEVATPPTGPASALADCPAPGAPSTSPGALPDLRLACLDGDGTALPLRRLTGTPTVLNLWASWCAPCRTELPAFSALARDAGGRLRVLGVASQEPASRSAEFAADAALPFPSLQDRSGDLGRALRRRGLPVTVLVAADGSVADVYQGPPLTGATLRALVRDKLGVDV